jgi:hypothetical protein
VSATGRGAKRRKGDFYETPLDTIEAAIPVWDRVLPGGLKASTRVIDPGAGHGRYPRALEKAGVFRSNIFAVEKDPRRTGVLRKLGYKAYCSDFLLWQPRLLHHSHEYTGVDLVTTNPAFSIIRPLVEHALTLNPLAVVLLVPLNFVASKGRKDWHISKKPDMFVLPKRPSFTGDGKTDSNEYVYMVWAKGTQGLWRLL